MVEGMEEGGGGVNIDWPLQMTTGHPACHNNQ